MIRPLQADEEHLDNLTIPSKVDKVEILAIEDTQPASSSQGKSNNNDLPDISKTDNITNEGINKASNDEPQTSYQPYNETYIKKTLTDWITQPLYNGLAQLINRQEVATRELILTSESRITNTFNKNMEKIHGEFQNLAQEISNIKLDISTHNNNCDLNIMLNRMEKCEGSIIAVGKMSQAMLSVLLLSKEDTIDIVSNMYCIRVDGREKLPLTGDYLNTMQDKSAEPVQPLKKSALKVKDIPDKDDQYVTLTDRFLFQLHIVPNDLITTFVYQYLIGQRPECIDELISQKIMTEEEYQSARTGPTKDIDSVTLLDYLLKNKKAQKIIPGLYKQDYAIASTSAKAQGSSTTNV